MTPEIRKQIEDENERILGEYEPNMEYNQYYHEQNILDAMLKSAEFGYSLSSQEAEKEIAKLKKELEAMYSNNKEGWTKVEHYEKEAGRLKELVENIYKEYGSRRMSQPLLEQSWQQFKTENQL